MGLATQCDWRIDLHQRPCVAMPVGRANLDTGNALLTSNGIVVVGVAEESFRMMVGVGSALPVVITTIGPRSPLWRPRSPEANRPRRPARNASWLRWAWDRWSRRTAS